MGLIHKRLKLIITVFSFSTSFKLETNNHKITFEIFFEYEKTLYHPFGIVIL